MPPKSPPPAGATPCPTQPDSGAPCTCFMVRSLSRKISQLYDDTLAPSGLKGTQFSLLAQARVRRGQEPLSVSALAQRLNTDRTTMTRNLGHATAARLREAHALAESGTMIGKVVLEAL